MSVRDDILSFLRHTEEFASNPVDRELWLAGLDPHVSKLIDDHDAEWPLRQGQIDAWRGLADNRAGLVLGPPGTGKTHLLAWFIVGYALARQAAGKPCRILVSAFTRNAIGNLLDAVGDRVERHDLQGLELAYCGSPPAGGLRPNLDHFAYTGPKDLANIAQWLSNEHAIVGATVWTVLKLLQSGELPGSDGPTAPVFDLICIDEASQMPLSHGLMLLAGIGNEGRLVVAGDDKQLPPIRVSRDIEVGGRELGGSLYTFLQKSGVAEFALNETFRLNAPLATFPERHFYPGEYESAVEDKQLKLPHGWEEGLKDWEREILDPRWPICVLLHDGPPAASRNPFEAQIAAQLAHHLNARLASDGTDEAKERFWRDQLAIVSPHRAHNHEIRAALGKLSEGSFVETVDRIQGRERDVVILSYCVADGEFALVEAPFIYAKERLNVAVTRAGCKLIVLVSRRLLETVPGDQEVLDQAQLLREFVYDCHSAGSINLEDKDRRPVPVEIRLRGFSEESVLPEIQQSESEDHSGPEMNSDLEDVLQAIREISNANARYRTAADFELQHRLARQNVLHDLVDLHHLGWIDLSPRNGPHGEFWVARPFDDQRKVYPVEADTLFERLEEAIPLVRSGRFAPFYTKLRSRFAWMNHEGKDVLWPAIEPLRDEGRIVIGHVNDSLTVELPATTASYEDEVRSELPELTDGDFELLNLLEDQEASKINFGVFESWVSPQDLAVLAKRSRREVRRAIERLERHGYLMIAADDRLRSRMAELAREIRYVKQRFMPQDAHRRPYLVRSLKLEIRDRNKPSRDIVLSDQVAKLSRKHAHNPLLQQALVGLDALLRKRWAENAKIAGFQARGLESIIDAWAGDGARNFVIAADTGAGKTEAACLPMFVAAAADRLAGHEGCFALIAYPRIRLAANQAQRLAGYLADYSQIEGMPLLTLGMQTGEVPSQFERLYQNDKEIGWKRLDDNTFTFPLFTCPKCDGKLSLSVAAGEEGADRLDCASCNWSYRGWVGSKEGLASTPPNFFLPTTDSLHQWLQNPRYGALFGDQGNGHGPRFIMADEIHLYSHIHGAQVGHVLRRCAERSASNRNSRPIMIGMSATLGDPAQAWERLIGQSGVETISAKPEEADRNPRGREYFYFVQPEVESRGKDIAGAATTIQSAMCLAHGMRRRTGSEGGFRSLVFLDSIDKLRRMHSAFTDAEQGKALASLRTKLYSDDPQTGDPRRECCGEPFGCDRFRDGECWFFAATDKDQQSCSGRIGPGTPLRVSEQPVSSASSGRIGRLIGESDIVFSTSSLEVGFDDPNITMVYQHYAPQNLASFIQRKGRGGRGIDDRPLTGVTLSIYSPRDSWWFARPHQMIDPDDFDVAINPNNHFVLRGQILGSMLDALARLRSVGANPFREQFEPTDTAAEQMTAHAEATFGKDIWQRLGFDEPGKFWAAAIAEHHGELGADTEKWHRVLDWIASPLFASINLPVVRVHCSDSDRDEDIMLALSAVAPGNVTRRFHPSHGHWIEPRNGRAPWLADRDYQQGRRVPLPLGRDGDDNILSHLPHEFHQRVAGEIEPALFRPIDISLEKLGVFRGAEWQSNRIGTHQDGLFRISDRTDNDWDNMIHHESRGELVGFPVVLADQKMAKSASLGTDFSWLSRLDAHCGDALGGQSSGLDLANVYWGAESEIRLNEPGAEPGLFSQIFTDPTSGKPLLHGFQVRTEGVRFHLDSQAISAFVKEEQERLADDESARRWHGGQLIRFLVESRAREAGINGYEASRAAELFVAAAGDPELRKDLKRLFKFWDADKFGQLLERARASTLSSHPLLSPARVEKVAASLRGPQFAKMFKGIVKDANDDQFFAGYLRTLVVHGLAQRLKQSFIIAGQGDDRRIAVHARLPIQFDRDIDDVITIAEIGAGGDGTARSFVENITKAEALWRDGFLHKCLNAEDDAVILRFFEQRQNHSQWKSIDPDNTDHIKRLAVELGGDPQRGVPQSLLRILFANEEVGAERIALYDVACEIHNVANQLQARFARKPSTWEVTSAAVVKARKGDAEWLSRLYDGYAGLDGASLDDSLSPEARMADQVYALSARLCVDGCQACLHTKSDLMPDSQLQATVSRQVLHRFLTGR